MRKCPKCGSWSFDFDEYFGRFRCFNHQCNWMPVSACERQMRHLRTGNEPEIVKDIQIPELELHIITRYDHDLDYLMFDFGKKEPSFDIPEPDGRMIWQVSHESREVIGFIIIGPKEFGLFSISISIQARKQRIEEELRNLRGRQSQNQITRNIIEKIVIETTVCPPKTSSVASLDRECEKILERLPQLLKDQEEQSIHA